MSKKLVIKYRFALGGVLLVALMMVAFSYINYVKEQIPEKIYIGEYSDGTIDFDLPFVGTASLVGVDGKVIESSLDLSGPLTINAGGIAEYNINVKLFGLLDIKNVKVEVKTEESVVVGGIPVGIYIETDGVLIVDVGEITTQSGEIEAPAKGALMAGDYILAVDGTQITGKNMLIEKIEEFSGDYLEIKVKRNNEVQTVKVKPVKDAEGIYKLGVWIRDDCQGLGTLTYIDSEGGFGTLGHAISDADTGEIIDVEKGELYTAKIWSIIKGQEGSPGEIIGSINYGEKSNIGVISDNETIGIYGDVNEQVYAYVDKVYMEVAYKQDVKEGTAYIRSFVGDEIKDYEIDIFDLDYADGSKNKGIEFTVVDKELLSITNGIVQGMSGSPIIQDGKIVGAVTHVLVNDPTKGYGIFIENMLEHN